jgi:branched-chain amino acid aminotransferase
MVVFSTDKDDMFDKAGFIWFNGNFVSWDNATVHVLAHALHYGSAIFEGIRAYHTSSGRTAVFRLRDHIKRLFDSAKVYMIDIEEDTGFSMNEIIKAVKETVSYNGLKEAYIRPLVFRDYIDYGDKWGFLGISPLKCKVSIIIAAFEWAMYVAPKLKVITVPYRRLAPDGLPLLAKASGHYLNSQLARMYADYIQSYLRKANLLGDDEGIEALMLDHRGYVSEGSGENIFIVKEEKIYTPPVNASILKGVTRDSIFAIAKRLGYTVIERELVLSEIYSADECFMTGTAAEIKPILEVDFRKIGNGGIGRVTKEIMLEFSKIVKGEIPEFKHWLDYID